MSDFIKGFQTVDGLKQYDYEALGNLPKLLETFYVNIKGSEYDGWVVDKTNAEVYQAHKDGKLIYCMLNSDGISLLLSPITIDSGTSIFGTFAGTGSYAAEITGSEVIVQQFVLPFALPNPYPLIFTGAVSGSYDGSSEKTINIPSAYTLPNAGTSLGGVKSGGVATISGGQITAISQATSADSATSATTATTANKVANSLTIQGNGTTVGTFNGSAAESVNIKGAGSTTVTGADGVITITGATIPTSLKNPKALTIGSKTYDGSSAVNIVASDLGLSNALHFIGSVTELPQSATNGDVVLLGSKEYVYSNGWVELGDGDSHALKTITISAGDGLTGGGNLSANRTISHADTSSQSSVSASGRRYITGVTLDGYGHVTGLTTGTETVTDTNTTYSAGTGLSLSGTTFNHKNSVTAKTTNNQATVSPGYGGTFKVTEPLYDAQGHITGTNVATITMPPAQTIPSLSGGTAAAANAKVIGGVTVSGHTITAAEKTLVAGSNVSITGATDKITISATDTTYSAATQSSAGLMSAADKKKLDEIPTGGGTGNDYSLPTASSSTLGGVKIGSNINISNGVISVPSANETTAGVTLVYPAASCTTFTSDSGACSPAAVQKGAKQFAITRPSSVTDKAIVRYSGTNGDVQNSKIIIEDVTNTRDSSKTAQIIAIPAEAGKKMVYGYCTDQIDGTSFIGGIFDVNATEYPYAQGLAIGGTSGNLLWKGAKVAVVSDIPSSLKNPNSLTVKGEGTQSFVYDGSAAKTLNIKGSGATSVTSDTNGNITISSTNTTYSAASTTANGLMTSAMVTKLNGIATGATKVTVDTAMSSTSTNPVQNKAVYAAIETAKSDILNEILNGSW